MQELLASALVNLLVFGIALGAFYHLCFLSGTPNPHAQDVGDKPSVSLDHSIDERKHGTSTDGTTAKSPTTYRLQGISAENNIEEIPKLLREAWDIPESIRVEVHSLAANPRRPEKKIATVSFNRTPEFLRSSKETYWVSMVNDKLVLDTHFRGFTPLHSGSDSNCVLDCIAVSGLGGHAFGSFKSKDRSFMWLRDALPEDLPQSRIFIYGYDAESVNSRSFENITDLGIQLQQSIKEIRSIRHDYVKPLVLIGHSLGGLVVKQAIINMHESQAEDDKANLHALRAALFFAVPTLGMNIESLIPMVEGKPNEDLVKSLKGTSETLRRQKEPFDIASQSFSKYWYYETKESPTARLMDSGWSMTGPDALLVDPHSATNGRARSSEQDHHFVEPINRTHSEVVKFTHQEDPYYAMVSGHLKRIKEDIPRNNNGRICVPLTSAQFECVRSLAIANQESRKRSIDLVAGTCKWIESHPIFQTWKRSLTGTLWIRGQPGSGKSSLMKYLSDTLDCENPNIASPVVVSFFFHGTGLEVHRSLFGFYSVLLNQLLPEIPQFCHDIFEKYAQDRSRLGEKFGWEMQELRDFLSSIIFKAISAGIPIILLADALDEAGQVNAMELMRFFRSIENSAKKATDGIHRSLRICFSCRPYPVIVGQEQNPIIDVDQHNKEDLSIFVSDKLKPDPSVGIEDGVLKEVQNEIISKTGRTFQWANLMIKEVGRMFTEMDTMVDIHEQISRTPSDLHQFYSQLVSPNRPDGKGNAKYSPKEQALTLKLFQWLCFSKGPLTLATIKHALVLGPEKHDIVEPSKYRDFQTLKAMVVTVTKLSRGLAEVRRQNSKEIVQFTHQSVYDFLLEGGLADLAGSEIAGLEPLQQTMKVKGLGHFQISRTCMTAMVMEDTKDFIETHRLLSKSDRRVEFNPTHSAIDRNGYERRSFKFPDCCESLLSMCRRFGRIDIQRSLREHLEKTIPVAVYGSEHLCHHLEAVEKCGWDQSDLLNLFNTNLIGAWQDIVLLGMIDHDQLTLTETSSITHVLAASGITSALRYFLRQDPRCCSVEDGQGNTALHCAIGKSKGDATKFLIQEARECGCIDIDHPRNDGTTPLHYAIRYGMEDVAQTLIWEGLNHGTVDFDRPDNNGETPLHHALQNGSVDVAKTLIREGLNRGTVNLDRPNRDGKTPLHHALQNGNGDVAQTLIWEGLNHGTVDLDWPDNDGRTPLHYAIEYDQKKAVDILMKKTLDSSWCSNLSTLAYRPCRTHRTNIVDVCYPDRRSRAPLFIAAPYKRADDRKNQLDTGIVNVEHKNRMGETPLAVAARVGCVAIAELLLEHGASVDSQDYLGYTPLFHALRASNVEMTKYLVQEASAKIDILDNYGRSILSHAAEKGSRPIREYIFAIASAKLEIEDANGKLPLIHALNNSRDRWVFDFLKTDIGCSEEALLINVARHDPERLVHSQAGTAL